MKPQRPGFWLRFTTVVALLEMRVADRRNDDHAVIRWGESVLRRSRGNAELYRRLSGAHWGLSHWKLSIRYGRMALALKPDDHRAATFMLASYRSLDPERGIVFGERWLECWGMQPLVARHVSFLYDDADRNSEALAIAERALARSPRDLRLAACVANYRAKVHGANDALDFARRYAFSRDDYCISTLAHGLSAVGAHAESEKLFRRLTKKKPEDSKLFIGELDALFHQGKYKDLIATVEKWETVHPMTAPVANEKARGFLELEQFDQAIPWFERAVRLAPESVKFADNLAIAFGRAGRHAEGVQATLERLKVSGSDRLRLLKSLGADYNHLEQHETALVYYRQAYAEFPQNEDVLEGMVIGLNWVEQREEAVDFAKEHAERSPGKRTARFWSEYAWALNCLSRYPEEEAVVRLWAIQYPNDDDVPRVMRRTLHSQNRIEDALAYLNGWVAAHPANSQGWRQLAYHHEKAGDRAGEIAALTEACRLTPNDGEYVADYVAALRAASRPREAYEIGTKWIRENPSRVTPALLNRVGLAADDLEDWKEAETLLRSAQERAPSNAVIMGNLVRALIKQGHPLEASERARDWMEAHSWEPYVVERYVWALQETGQLEAQTAGLSRAIEHQPNDPELYRTLLECLVKHDRTEEAAGWIERARAAGQIDSSMMNDWAIHLSAINRLSDAEAAYREALRLRPQNPSACGNLAALLTDNNRTQEAIDLCREWQTAHGENNYVTRQVAHAYYSMGQYTTAESLYRVLLAADSSSGFLAGRLVACIRLQSRYRDALKNAFEWLGQGHQETAFLRIEMGICETEQDAFEAALPHYEAALKLDPAREAAAIRKLRTLRSLQRFPEAAQFGEAWLSQNSVGPTGDFHNQLGIVSDQAGNLDGAERHFIRGAELSPTDATFLGNAVEILARRGKIEASLQLGQKFLNAHPPNAYLLRRIAESYSLDHDHGPALDLLASADSLDPTDSDVAIGFFETAVKADQGLRGVEFGRAWLAREGNQANASVWARFARVCFWEDLDDEAFTALENAAKLEPDKISHAQQRFAFRSTLSESTQILREFETLRPEWHDDPEVLRYVSKAYFELGLHSEAVATAERNVSLNPGDDTACAWLAKLHLKSGDTEAAARCVESWLKLHGEVRSILKMRAELELGRANFAGALIDAEKCLDEDQSDEDAFVMVIRALRGLERHQEARSRLNRWIEHHGGSRQVNRLIDDTSE